MISVYLSSVVAQAVTDMTDRVLVQTLENL